MLRYDYFMQLALNEAKKCLRKNEIPVGAIIVDEFNNIISKGHNKVQEKKNPLFHAEKIAIDKALLRTNKKYLDNCDIWVTLQPCQMCMGMIKQVRIKRLYYGASIPDSIIKNKINNKVCNEVYSGIKEDECSKLIRDFFKEIRSD
jgi:tRNA(adenine34) deaminase